MKFYQLCVLICVTSCAIAHQNIDLSPECIREVPEIMELQNREKKCLRQLMERDEFAVDLNATLLGYNGNADEMLAMQEFLNKYCANTLDFLECYLSSIPDVSGLECKSALIKHNFKLKMYNGIMAMMTYNCDNDAEMLKKLIPHDGLHFVFFNTDFKRCHFAPDHPRVSPESIEESCAILESSRTCMLRVSADHENKDIAVNVNEAFARAKNTVGC